MKVTTFVVLFLLQISDKASTYCQNLDKLHQRNGQAAMFLIYAIISLLILLQIVICIEYYIGFCFLSSLILVVNLLSESSKGENIICTTTILKSDDKKPHEGDTKSLECRQLIYEKSKQLEVTKSNLL